MKENNQLMKIVVLVFTLAICAIFSGVVSYGQNAPKIRINPSHAYGGHVSEYFDKIEYIPLETTKESTFGDIYEMIVTDSSFVVSDIDTKSIFFFSHDGKYINRIVGQFYMMYDQINNHIISYKFSSDQTKIRLSYFSLLGKKIYEDLFIDLKSNSTNTINAFSKFIDKDYFLHLNSCLTAAQSVKNDTCYLFSINKKGSFYKNVILVDRSIIKATKKMSAYVSLPGFIQNGSFYTSSPLDFNIYKINKDTVIGVFQLVFPVNRVLPKGVIESDNDKVLDSVYKSVYTSRTLIVNIENIFFRGSAMFFKLKIPSSVISQNNSINEYQYNYAYDTISKKMFCLDKITADSGSYFLPIMGETSKMKGLIPAGDKFIYSYISSLTMFNYYNTNKNMGVQYPIELLDYFKFQSGKSNPVIVRMILK